MLHKNLTLGDQHPIHNWEVADAAALAALVVVAADIGKMARQLSTNSFFILKSVGPAVWSSEVGKTPPVGLPVGGAAGQVLSKVDGTDYNAAWTSQAKHAIPIAVSDETTALTTGAGKVTFRMPYAFTLTDVRASLTTAQTSGSLLTVNVKESGVSIFSTKITIDNTEKSSVTAAALPVISDANLADDAEITIDLDQLGDGTAKGLKVYLIGRPA
jgi:hypothetical protein